MQLKIQLLWPGFRRSKSLDFVKIYVIDERCCMRSVRSPSGSLRDILYRYVFLTLPEANMIWCCNHFLLLPNIHTKSLTLQAAARRLGHFFRRAAFVHREYIACNVPSSWRNACLPCLVHVIKFLFALRSCDKANVRSRSFDKMDATYDVQCDVMGSASIFAEDAPQIDRSYYLLQ